MKYLTQRQVTLALRQYLRTKVKHDVGDGEINREIGQGDVQTILKLTQTINFDLKRYQIVRVHL